MCNQCFADLTCRFLCIKSVVGPRFCISNKLPVMLMLLAHGPHFEEQAPGEYAVIFLQYSGLKSKSFTGRIDAKKTKGQLLALKW